MANHHALLVARFTARTRQLERYEGETKVRVAPFDAIEFELGALRI